MRKKKETPDSVEKESVNENKEECATPSGETSEQQQDENEKKSGLTEEDFMKLLAESQDRYLRLSAEFDNYRKRTLREKMELSKTAGEEILAGFLPLMDDFDRAQKAMHESADVNAILEGIDLIHKKMSEFLSRKGVKEIPAMGESFNTDLHEAVTTIPAPDESLKGKVADVIQKGYTLHEKVIRFAKVVIGE